MNHRILTTLVFSSLIFISSCTINIIQSPLSSGAKGDRPPKTDDLIPSQPQQNINFLDDVSSEEDDTLLCEPFEFPALEEVPQFPYVPPEKRNDDAYVSELLVEHLNRLTDYIDRTDRIIRDKYDAYIERCR